MVAQSQRKARLDRKIWLDAALSALVQGGIASVTIEKLATGLGVTRGSFYHHFQDRPELLKELLDYWVQNWTLAITEDISALSLDPRNSLLALIRLIYHRHAADKDVAFRAWALHDEEARKIVSGVDEIRLDYVKSLYQGMGFKGLDAENRARLTLYYQVAEPTLFHTSFGAMDEELVVARHALLTAGADP